jgi:hypothetical protein
LNVWSLLSSLTLRELERKMWVEWARPGSKLEYPNFKVLIASADSLSCQ